MKDDDGTLPPDLADAELPPELQRALRALANERPSAARLAQVAAKLAPLLDAAPPSYAPSSLLRGAVGKSMATKLIVAALGVGGAIASLRYFSPLAPAAPPSTPAPEAAFEQSDRRSGAEPRASTAAQPEHAAPHAPAEPRAATDTEAPDRERSTPSEISPTPAAHGAAAPISARAPEGSLRRRPSRVAGRERDARHASSARTSADLAPPSAPSAAVAKVADPAADETAAEPKTSDAKELVAELPPAPQPAPAALVPREGEVELLLSARKTLKKAPKEALRALEEHARRFPQGVLAPEREVLAIEALRLSGNATAADHRLRAFQKNYPNSMHLVRLGRKQPESRE